MRNTLIIVFAFMLSITQMTRAQLTITGSGQVGIGIETPNADSKLHVVHDDYYAGYFTSSMLSSTTKILRSEYNGSSGYAHVMAVYGLSEPNPGYGVGGLFRGGWRGVTAQATASGSGYRYGLYAQASGGTYNYGVYAMASGGTTNYAGYFVGEVYATAGYDEPSDRNLKENIIKLENILPKVKELSAKSYTFKLDSKYKDMNLPGGTRFGLIAQEVEEIFPEVVKTHEFISYENSDNNEIKDTITLKGLNYTQLIPILVQAIQEQQVMIDELKQKVDALK